MSKCVEIAEMKIAEGVDVEYFMTVVNDVENNFHCKQDGFISTELIQGKDGKSFIMVQHWESIELAKKASAAMVKSELSEVVEFAKLLDRKSIRLRFFESIRKWS